MSETSIVGKLGNEHSRRDAIHVAIAPCTASEMLKPGQHVRLEDGSYHVSVCLAGEGIGIVDPFLTENVRAGQICYVFLYPGTITALRHVWSHPAFKPKVPGEKVHE